RVLRRLFSAGRHRLSLCPTSACQTINAAPRLRLSANPQAISYIQFQYALPHLGLFRFLPDRLSRLLALPHQLPPHDLVVDVGLVHLLRLVVVRGDSSESGRLVETGSTILDESVSPSALQHLGDRLRHVP